MDANHLATIVAYYLSKFDKQGVVNLGFRNDSDAFKTIAKLLGVKENYIKIRRDEFDPVHPWRKGWQRPMAKQIRKTIVVLHDIEEEELREIVLQILYGGSYVESQEAKLFLDFIKEENNIKNNEARFVLRASTGKKAEEYFIAHFKRFKNPVDGKLIDCRDQGIGYDFRIESTEAWCFVEVKGLSDSAGGVLLTNKEWATARKEKKNYYLCVVSNLGENPDIIFIQDPFDCLKPKKSIHKIVQINWSVNEGDLRKARKSEKTNF